MQMNIWFLLKNVAKTTKKQECLKVWNWKKVSKYDFEIFDQVFEEIQNVVNVAS